MEDFIRVLENLLCGDNATRRLAEDQYAKYRLDANGCVTMLLAVVESAEAPRDARTMAVTLLRRSLRHGAHCLWPNLTAETQAHVQAQLLALLDSLGTQEAAAAAAESTGNAAADDAAKALRAQLTHLRTKLADVVSVLAVLLLDPESEHAAHWEALVPFLFQSAQSAAAGHRESAFSVFRMMGAYLGDQMAAHSQPVRQLLHSGLVDEGSLRVRIAALEAAANFLQVFTDSAERMEFQSLSPVMLNVVSAALNVGDEGAARTALELFVEFAEIDPKFLRPHLDMFVSAMITLATSDTLEQGTKHLGVEFLITLAESSPGMCRRMDKFVDTMLPVILRLMIDIEDDEGWFEGKEHEDDIEIRDSDLGEESLDRLALALGGKAIVPQLFAIIPGMLASPNWQQKHAALTSVCVIGEGCKTELSHHMDEIVTILSPYFADPHPRVRWACANAFGQLATDFAPTFQEKHHAVMVPALSALMGGDVPRVKAHAAAAMINFCDGADPDEFMTYAPDVLAKMMALLRSDSLLAQTQTVTAVAGVADCMQHRFREFYADFVPHLKAMLAATNDQPTMRELRGKLFECLTLIGEAVGPELFQADAAELMQVMLASQEASGRVADDTLARPLHQSMARVCRTLKGGFVPYLPFVMPPLLAMAAVEPEVSITDTTGGASGAGHAQTAVIGLSPDMASKGVVDVSEYQAATQAAEQAHGGAPRPGDKPAGWDEFTVGDKKVRVHTSRLEEKSTACHMLYAYAAELEEGFYPFVDQVSRVLVPLMEFYFHDGVRTASFTTMPALMQCVRMHAEVEAAAAGTAASAAGTATFFNYVFPFLHKAVIREVDQGDPETLEIAVEALAAFIASTGKGAITAEAVGQCFTLAHGLRVHVLERRAERQADLSDPDHDAEAQARAEAQDEADADVLLQVGEMVGQLAKNAPEAYLALFDQSELPGMINEMLSSTVARDRHFSVCVFDDMLEHLQEAALPMLPVMLPHWFQAAQDTNHAVRQAGVFGLGLACQFGGAAVAPSVPQIFQHLIAVIAAEGSREGEAAMATENAISAVGKLIQFQAASSGIEVQDLLATWLASLPAAADTIEAKVIYRQLVHFATDPSLSPLLLGGEGLGNLARVLHCIWIAHGTEFSDDELNVSLHALHDQLAASYPEQVTAAVAKLNPELQAKIAAAQQAATAAAAGVAAAAAAPALP